MFSTIGTLAEKSLHASLKNWYGRSGDQFEVSREGFVIDIVRDNLFIEIQTRHFSALKRKLIHLLKTHPVHLIHPIAQEKWIVRQTAVGEPVVRRKSPKRGQIFDVFNELVHMPHLLRDPNLTLMVLLTQQEEIWRDDGAGSWRRQHWSLHDKCLIQVVELYTFHSMNDFVKLLPKTLPMQFTNQDLAVALNGRSALAGKITYTLRQTDLLSLVGKRRNAHLYQLKEAPCESFVKIKAFEEI